MSASNVGHARYSPLVIVFAFVIDARIQWKCNYRTRKVSNCANAHAFPLPYIYATDGEHE